MFRTAHGANAIRALRCCHLYGRFGDYWEALRGLTSISMSRAQCRTCGTAHLFVEEMRLARTFVTSARSQDTLNSRQQNSGIYGFSQAFSDIPSTSLGIHVR